MRRVIFGRKGLTVFGECYRALVVTVKWPRLHLYGNFSGFTTTFPLLTSGRTPIHTFINFHTILFLEERNFRRSFGFPILLN